MLVTFTAALWLLASAIPCEGTTRTLIDAAGHIRTEKTGDEEELNLIPLPTSIQRTAGSLQLPLRIDAPSDDLAEAVRTHVFAKAGLAEGTDATAKAIRLSLSSEHSQGNPEGYSLIVSQAGVEIESSTEHGLFNGVMTLHQLLQKGSEGWTVPHVEVKDAPNFTWRGLMLDVSRHFFNVDDVKKLLHTMALFKLNHLHLHLTDDQGWRVQVDQFPLLVQTGAVRSSTQVDHESSHQDHKRVGGYFSKHDLTEIVNYAKKLHIDVMPEFDLPGHADAALAAYPELGNVDIPHWVKPEEPAISFGGGAADHTLAPTHATVNFLETVLDEAMSVMPSHYVHLGGDEVSTREWSSSPTARQFMLEHKLGNVKRIQGYFNEELGKHVAEKGRQVVLWDEAFSAGSAPKDAVVMVWNPGSAAQVAKRAAEAGHDVVLAPWGYTYFDQAQASSGEPMGQGGVVELSHVYSMPISSFVEPGTTKGKVLGGQGQLWSEYFPDWHQVEYMAWPRGIALAEVLWKGDARPDFEDFRQRLGPRLEELGGLGVAFRDPSTHMSV